MNNEATVLNVEFYKNQCHGAAKEMLDSESGLRFMVEFDIADALYAVVVRNRDSIELSATDLPKLTYGSPSTWSFTNDLYEALKEAAKNKKNSNIYEWDLGINLLF